MKIKIEIDSVSDGKAEIAVATSMLKVLDDFDKPIVKKQKKVKNVIHKQPKKKKKKSEPKIRYCKECGLKLIIQTGKKRFCVSCAKKRQKAAFQRLQTKKKQQEPVAKFCKVCSNIVTGKGNTQHCKSCREDKKKEKIS